MEGKEVRFGVANSATFAAATTLTSTGAVNSFHDSYTALGGMMPLINMMLGEVAPGGVGAGLYGMLVVAVLTVFVAGLMVGRTPEYLGKKIGAREIKFASLYFLTTPVLVLVGTAMALATGNSSTALNVGPHGFSEVLYAFTSASNNNGSAFAGITVNTPWWNTALGLAMLLGRFLPIVLVLGLAGSLARQQPGARPAPGLCRPTGRCSSPWCRGSCDLGRAELPTRPSPRPTGRRALTDPRRTRDVGHVNRGTPRDCALPPGCRWGCWSRDSSGWRCRGPLRKLNPATPVAQPGHVHRRGRRHVHHGVGRCRPVGVRLVDHRLAVAHRGLRQPCGVGGRGPRQGPGRYLAESQAGDGRPTPGRVDRGRHAGRVRRRSRRRRRAAAGRHRRRRGRTDHSRRRRRHRGDRQRRRVGDHRRVGPGHPRVGRRPLGGHRRHPGAVRPDRGADHPAAWRELHRPDDRSGRGGEPAEDPERDRAQHPARRV